MTRDMNFAGSFYPREKEEVKSFFDEFSKVIDENIEDSSVYKKPNPKAVIVPHAGYVYSGLNATLAYKAVEDLTPETVAVIGPSHHFYFEDISIGDFDSVLTPFGEIACDTDLIQDLKKSFDLTYYKDAHMEHSTEVQFPFLKTYFPNAKIVEFVYGNFTGEKLEAIVDRLIEKGVFVVISTDLSHFYDLDVANQKDAVCIEAIDKQDVQMLDLGCEACGKRGVKAILEVAKSRGLNTKVLYHNTSADTSGDSSRVVGYLSGLIY